MAKKTNGTKPAWSKAHERELKGHSRAKTPVAKISKLMKRTAGALRQEAAPLGSRSDIAAKQTYGEPPPVANSRLPAASFPPLVTESSMSFLGRRTSI